jgi:hypothetical protein
MCKSRASQGSDVVHAIFARILSSRDACRRVYWADNFFLSHIVSHNACSKVIEEYCRVLVGSLTCSLGVPIRKRKSISSARILGFFVSRGNIYPMGMWNITLGDPALLNRCPILLVEAF